MQHTLVSFSLIRCRKSNISSTVNGTFGIWSLGINAIWHNDIMIVEIISSCHLKGLPCLE